MHKCYSRRTPGLQSPACTAAPACNSAHPCKHRGVLRTRDSPQRALSTPTLQVQERPTLKSLRASRLGCCPVTRHAPPVGAGKAT